MGSVVSCMCLCYTCVSAMCALGKYTWEYLDVPVCVGRILVTDLERVLAVLESDEWFFGDYWRVLNLWTNMHKHTNKYRHPQRHNTYTNTHMHSTSLSQVRMRTQTAVKGPGGEFPQWVAGAPSTPVKTMFHTPPSHPAYHTGRAHSALATGIAAQSRTRRVSPPWVAIAPRWSLWQTTVAETRT